MSEYKGKLIILDMMATWCSYCQYSYPELQELKQAYPQVEIFTVSVEPNDTPEAMITYASSYDISWHVVLDIDGIGKTSRFDVTGTPTTFLIDKDFNIVEKGVGVTTFQVMEQWIANRL